MRHYFSDFTHREDRAHNMAATSVVWGLWTHRISTDSEKLIPYPYSLGSLYLCTPLPVAIPWSWRTGDTYLQPLCLRSLQSIVISPFAYLQFVPPNSLQINSDLQFTMHPLSLRSRKGCTRKIQHF